jgi:hypothetical protein
MQYSVHPPQPLLRDQPKIPGEHHPGRRGGPQRMDIGADLSRAEFADARYFHQFDARQKRAGARPAPTRDFTGKDRGRQSAAADLTAAQRQIPFRFFRQKGHSPFFFPGL